MWYVAILETAPSIARTVSKVTSKTTQIKTNALPPPERWGLTGTIIAQGTILKNAGAGNILYRLRSVRRLGYPIYVELSTGRRLIGMLRGMILVIIRLLCLRMSNCGRRERSL